MTPVSKKQKAHDPTWVERDVIFEEIESIARDSGMTNQTVVPMPHPDDLMKFDLDRWLQFRFSDWTLHKNFCDRLADLNNNSRIIFYTDRLALTYSERGNLTKSRSTFSERKKC